MTLLMYPTVTYWMGRPITELTREELIEVVEFVAAELREYQSPRAIEQRALGSVEMMKRGMPPQRWPLIAKLGES